MDQKVPLGTQQSILQDLKKIEGRRLSFKITISGEDLQNVYYLYI